MKKIILTLIILLAIAAPVFVFAATGLGAAAGNLSKAGSGAGVDTNQQLQDVVGTVINAALTLVGIIFMILMIYAGYLWMTAREQEEMVEKAKKIITASIIGLVVVISAYAVTVFVTKRFESVGTPATAPETPSQELNWCLTVEKQCVQGSGGPCSGTLLPDQATCEAAASAGPVETCQVKANAPPLADLCNEIGFSACTAIPVTLCEVVNVNQCQPIVGKSVGELCDYYFDNETNCTTALFGKIDEYCEWK